jgi:hypothetical protein
VNAFTQAATALHGDANVAVDATFTPRVGSAVSLSAADSEGVVISAGDETHGGFDTGYRRSRTRITVLQGALAGRPQDGDEIQVGSREFVIRGADPDAEGVSWQLDVDEKA